jgi:hypothetical protein
LPTLLRPVASISATCWLSQQAIELSKSGTARFVR